MKTFINRFKALSMAAILTIGFGFTYAQNGTSYYTVNGVIKDSKTKQKVIFASVSVPGTNVGTVSNSDGEFTLKVQKSLNIKEFEISHLGYINKKFAITESTEEQVFLVDPFSVELKELVVKGLAEFEASPDGTGYVINIDGIRYYEKNIRLVNFLII